ncbi:MAG: Mu-like prophage major head subunit gpT family protein [Thermoplasmata archaeon]
MTNRSLNTELLQRDMYKYMFEKYDPLPKVFPQIFEMRDTTAAFEKETTGIGLGGLSERKEGSQIIASNPLEGFTVYGKPRTWSDAFELTMEFTEDTPPEKVANIARAYAATWAEGTLITQETFCANFFNYGGLTAGYDNFDATITGVIDDPTGDLAYDGLPFFNLTGNRRYSKAGGSYYNGLALSLDNTNLQTAYLHYTTNNNRNERDQKISLQPDVLLIPSALRFTAKSILENDWVGGNANLDKNTVQNLVQPLEWQYLSDTDAWFLGKKQKGLVFLNRRLPVIDFYTDPKTKAEFVTIDTRWGAYMNNWRYWLGSNFATS